MHNTLEIIAKVPIDRTLVPKCLEDIIDKRIAGVALSALEEFVNWFLSWVYSPYNTLFETKAKRICTFQDDEVRMCDSTEGGIVKVKEDAICLTIDKEERPLYFYNDTRDKMVFKKLFDCVEVRHASKNPRCIEICCYDPSRPNNGFPTIWRVDLDHPVTIQVSSTDIRKMYFVQKPD